MSNLDLVNAFVARLLEAPDLTMQAVQLRLSATDYELVLKKADPLKHFEHPDPYQFPLMTAQKCAVSEEALKWQ